MLAAGGAATSHLRSDLAKYREKRDLEAARRSRIIVEGDPQRITLADGPTTELPATDLGLMIEAYHVHLRQRGCPDPNTEGDLQKFVCPLSGRVPRKPVSGPPHVMKTSPRLVEFWLQVKLLQKARGGDKESYFEYDDLVGWRDFRRDFLQRPFCNPRDQSEQPIPDELPLEMIDTVAQQKIIDILRGLPDTPI